jgi:hypothetical protein
MLPPLRTSETSVYICLTTRQYIPEDSGLHTRRSENLKSYRSSAIVTFCVCLQTSLIPRLRDFTFTEVSTKSSLVTKYITVLEHYMEEYYVLSVWLSAPLKINKPTLKYSNSAFRTDRNCENISHVKNFNCNIICDACSAGCINHHHLRSVHSTVVFLHPKLSFAICLCL